MTERTLSSRMVFEGRILKLRVDEVETSDGHRSTREVIEHQGAVGVVAVHDGKVVLVRQYRYAPQETLLEIPAGKLDAGEDPASCAARELEEEVGLRPLNLEHLATYYTTPGFSDEQFHLYYADSFEVTDVNPDPGEVLTVEHVALEGVADLMASGAVKDSKSLLGLSLLRLRA